MLHEDLSIECAAGIFDLGFIGRTEEVQIIDNVDEKYLYARDCMHLEYEWKKVNKYKCEVWV